MLLLPSVKLAHGMSHGVVILHIRTFTLTIWHPNIKRIRHSVTDLVWSIPSWTTTTELQQSHVDYKHSLHHILDMHEANKIIPLTHARVHKHTRTHTHTRTHAQTHTHTHTQTHTTQDEVEDGYHLHQWERDRGYFPSISERIRWKTFYSYHVVRRHTTTLLRFYLPSWMYMSFRQLRVWLSVC